MKTKRTITHFLLVLLLGLIATVSFGCMNISDKNGSENVIKEERTIGSFTKLDVGGAFTVILTQGAQEKLVLEADADEIKEIKTEVVGSTLKIYTESNWDSHFDNMTIYLTFKSLEYMDFSGAVDVNCENELTFTDLEMDVSGAAEIDLAITADEFDAEFSGASEISFRGKATTCSFDLSGASEFDAENLECQDLSVEVSGASEAKVWATGNLKIDASGASSIRYKGNPKISLDESGASSVKPL